MREESPGLRLSESRLSVVGVGTEEKEVQGSLSLYIRCNCLIERENRERIKRDVELPIDSRYHMSSSGLTES